MYRIKCRHTAPKVSNRHHNFNGTIYLLPNPNGRPGQLNIPLSGLHFFEPLIDDFLHFLVVTGTLGRMYTIFKHVLVCFDEFMIVMTESLERLIPKIRP
jgi:hypothetical protein